MAIKLFKLFFGVFLVGIVLSLGFVNADCPSHHGNSTSCNADVNGCVWESNAEGGDWCGNDIGCCEDAGCWEWDGNESGCDGADVALNCTWNPLINITYSNGSVEFQGICMGEMGGFDSGCWNYDGDQGTCENQANGGSCSWSANDANQNPWCWIKTIGDAKNQNPLAETSDIGCCEQKGCWSHDGDQSSCNVAFQGNCLYDDGWCNPKFCSEITTEDNCTYVQKNLFMPCDWNISGDEKCEAMGGGGFSFYDDNADTCFNSGGWYDFTGDGSCVMPSGDNGVGFMFGGETHCWFADHQPSVCGNVTGCAYCISGSGPYGVENETDNICYNAQVDWCEGHVAGDATYSNADNSVNLNCTHIEVKSACNYGPLPSCTWTNNSASSGAGYCEVGISSKKNAPPVGFCEHPDSKNNYTLCMELIGTYMMPCTWDNTSAIVNNCSFNPGAVFGSGGETDIGGISSETACTASGGTWQTEYYVDDGVLKQDSWCEMTGFFSIDNGAGEGNKGNCDTSCWACEFKYDGSAWENESVAGAACIGSALGYCSWEASNNSFNGLGWCDYPNEMEEGGAKDCNLECEGCNFMNNPEEACGASVANNGVGCKWVSEGTNNYCVNKAKKTCSSDCFSCYTTDSCQNSSLNCAWDNNLCQPQGFDGEICFDGIDNDNDNMIDCSDPDCGFDNFCGGSFFGGDCFAQTTEGTCNQTVAFDNSNCTWINDTWNPEGWCDMPGANCWQFDNDMVACGLEPGCVNDSSSFGGPAEMCDINKTRVESANCWEWDGNEANCNIDSECQWVTDPWCAEGNNSEEDPWCVANPNMGWCDYKPFATCMRLNETSCSINDNCTWNQDEYSMQGGWCDVACFNWSISSPGDCASAGSAGLCEWRDMSKTCQPEMFMMMGSPNAEGKTGCWQYDGNETACGLNNVVCAYKNDSYANNNVSENESAGWCMDKAEFEHFGDMEGDVIDLAMDGDNFVGFPPINENGVSASVDLMGMGMRVTDSGFNFGAGVYNISESLMCNGYMIGNMDNFFALKVKGNGDKTTKFYWYLDTDGSEVEGCEAVPSSGSNLTGFDFMISYVTRNTTNGVVETKQLMRCSGGEWLPTSALVTTSKKISCGEIGGVMVAVSKQDLESFPEYSKTANVRIFMASANDSYSRINPSDSVGPGYYTPGMIDFGFVDCSNPSTKDPKCKNMQKFGFNVFEECMNGIDDDENGLIDCYDPACVFSPKCAELLGKTAFAFEVDSDDKTAPTVMFSKVKTLSDAAFMKIDTNEPSSLNVTFYHNDSTCKTENKILSDVGSEVYQAYAKFKPFHSVDLTDDSDSLGYALENGTTYYYKIKVCDPSDNCAVSACSNFTTKSSVIVKQFVFKLDLPDGYSVDIPALNKTNYNFTDTFGGVVYDVGIKTNTSATKNMNITVHSNCGDGMSIGFYGVNIFGPTNIDMTNAFICNEDTNMMGMNSSLKKWNTLIDVMHLGGANDYIQIEMPVAYNSANTFNFVDDAGANPENVSAYVNCEVGTGGASTTACQVPVSLGF